MSDKDKVNYLSPDSLQIRNHIAMLPCGGLDNNATHSWTSHDLLPYTAYLVENKAIDHMFGGFIFNGICTRKKRYIYPLYVGFGEPSNQKDWSLWIDLLFEKNVNLSALNDAARDMPFDVWLSIPYPHPFQNDFGKVNSIALNFNEEEHRFVAVQWWLEQFLEQWENKIKRHPNLRLKGFLWQREAIDASDEDLVKQTNTFVKSKGFLTMWLPNYGSYGVLNCKELGFDVTAINSNYYGNTSYNFKWIKYASLFAKTYGTGMQINYGKGLIYNETHLLDYLNLGLSEHYDYMNKSLLVYQFANQRLREVYENKFADYIHLYMYTKGLYKRVDYPGINY